MKITPREAPAFLSEAELMDILTDFRKNKDLRCVVVEDEISEAAALKASFKKVIGRHYDAFKGISAIVFDGKCLLCKKTI